MADTITLYSIREVLDKNFFIPSYQRGYRWTKQHVEDLLEDIDEFDNTKDGKFYCLQPLVVKQMDNKWIVIDGQQRLTTIYLILKYLEKDNMNVFSLEYHREKHIEKISDVEFDSESKVENDNQLWDKYISNNNLDDNIEFYHLFKAKLVIHNWFNDKTDEFKNIFKQRLLNETKFIWYNVGKLNEHDLFRNLNSGKIALTNAELIKALFLNNVGIEISGKELKQNLIAEEFDQIERAFREDDFWYFLAGNEEKPASCIDLLFALMLDTADDQHLKLKESKDMFRTLFYFKKLIYYKNGGNRANDNEVYENAKALWKRVQTYFYTLQGWNRNADMYNLIGFLRALKSPKSLAELYLIFNDNEKSPNKIEFIKQLKEIIKKEINFEEEKYLNLNYHSPNIRNLLLFLNVATLLEKPKEKLKFSFADFHKYNWDIEHVSPQNPKSIDEFFDNNEKEKLPQELQKWRILSDEEKQELKNRYSTSEPDVLENMTLLTSHDNRGIGNKYFFEKREQLKTYFQQGSFIPPCSMNIFVKFYTVNPVNLNFWDLETDGVAYKSYIDNTIKNFFKKDTENDGM